MNRRRGLGVLVGDAYVRAVLVDGHGATVVARAAGVGAGDGSDLARALGAITALVEVPTRLAIDDPSTVVTTTSLDGLGAPGVATMLRRAAERGGDLFTVVGRTAVTVAWDAERADAIADDVARLGFDVRATEPAEVACARAGDADPARAAALAAAGVVAARPMRRLARPAAAADVWVVQHLPDPPAPQPSPGRRRRRRWARPGSGGVLVL